MLRILFFIGLVFLIGLGFAWLADRPGDMIITFGGFQYRVTLMVAAVIVTAVVAAVMLSWWVLKSIWYSPYTISRHFRVRRRDRGYQALSTGMIAAGAGDAGLARKKKKEAMKLINADQEPLVHLLDAQATLLEGDYEGARKKFEAMLDDPETRLLGLRGLYLEAERLGDRVAARHYAGRAAHAAPQLAWAADATLEEKTEAGEWEEALRLVETQKSTRQIDKDVANRRRAVLLTAKAIEITEIDPAGAKAASIEAHRLVPELVPAATSAAKALFRLGDLRKGSKILEASWKKQPHPEIADIYVHARSGDSTHDRLDRAKRLQSLRLNHVESAMVVARAALDAREFAIARREVESAIRLDPREGAYLLLADIEEAETGDQGRIRQWLGKAVRAPRDPAWVADNYISEKWAPVSPVTGRLDAFEWRAPSERLGQLVEFDDDKSVLPEKLSLPVTPVVPPVTPAPDNASEPEKKVPSDAVPTNTVPVETASSNVRVEPIEEKNPAVSDKAKESRPMSQAEPAAPEEPAVVKASMLEESPAMKKDAPVVKPAASTERQDGKPQQTESLSRLPDDPGVEIDEDAKSDTSRRFRLF